MKRPTVIVNLTNVSWRQLREQKRWLAEVADPINRRCFLPREREAAEGLLSFIDDIQDQAAEQIGERKVFKI